MAGLEAFLPTGHRYCSAMPALDKFSCSSVVPIVSPCCRSSSVVHPTWITELLTPQRCQWITHYPSSPEPAWKRLSASGRSVALDSNIPVLVRGEQDGFYYRGTVKEEIKNERGMFLVEFAKPLASRGRHPVCVQKTAKDDIIEYVNGMKHSLLPGDKVLAPWEPNMARYGPGTVLMGIETRDPLRASEDEEIMVHFWNDKKVKLPRGVALWIPPSLWERIVEMIHMPFTSRVKPREIPDTNCCIISHSPKMALIPVCAVHSLAKHRLLCLRCWPRFHYHCDCISCLSAYVGCICCCHPRVSAWWPLPSRRLVFQSETEEVDSSGEPSPCLLEPKSPKPEAAAVVAPSSPSSDSEWDLEPFPAKSTMVDSAVNTGSSCLEKPRLKDSARPEWKYWKRSHHKSHPSNSGLVNRSSTCTKGKLEPKAISTGDTFSVASTNRSAMFETIEQSPRGQLTMKEILRDQDFKLSLGVICINTVFM
uniref:Chromosome 11 open reading frame 16 n=1 Tax=Strigops habroptila TaxID=2489341 RepID=A0A672UP92_STRHB